MAFRITPEWLDQHEACSDGKIVAAGCQLLT